MLEYDRMMCLKELILIKWMCHTSALFAVITTYKRNLHSIQSYVMAVMI